MKSPAPPLLPIFRSRVQAEILGLILWSSPKEFSLTDISRRVGVSLATTQREISRSEKAEVVISRRVGNVRLVSANNSRDTELLTELLLRSFGPKQVVTEELAKVDGVDNVIIFGSWAARYLGTPGFAPNDLDLLILGKPNSHQIAKANIAIQNRIDRVVNSMSRPTSWWTNTSKDPLKKEIKRRPFIII